MSRKVCRVVWAKLLRHSKTLKHDFLYKMHLSNALKFIPIIITLPLLTTGVLCLAQG